MRNHIIAIIVLVSISAHAQISTGINGNVNYSTEDSKDIFDLSLGPCVNIMLNDKIELAPTLLFGYSSMTMKNYQEYKTSQSFLGASIGTYFHLYNNEFITFGLGPDLSGKYYFASKAEIGGDDVAANDDSKTMLSLGMPLNFDFHFGEKITLRLSSRILDLNVGFPNGGAAVSLKSLPIPSFNLLYNF